MNNFNSKKKSNNFIKQIINVKKAAYAEENSFFRCKYMFALRPSAMLIKSLLLTMEQWQKREDTTNLLQKKGEFTKT